MLNAKKIGNITREDLDKLKNSEDEISTLKSILNISNDLKYETGDTAVCIENSQVSDIFEKEFKGEKRYYIILHVFDNTLAYAFTFYPIHDYKEEE